MKKNLYTLFCVFFLCGYATNAQAQIINTIAGNSTPGFGGDGSMATGANLSSPRFTALDNAGNMYITDFDNNRIRKVDTAGIITTIAGTGTGSYSGDGTLATAAEINNPNDIIVDTAGNIYFADLANHRIRKINAAGIITTIAGSGTPGFSGDGGPAISAELYYPSGIAFDGNRNMYISDEWNNRIRRVDSVGIITTIAGIGPTGYLAGGDGGDSGPATAAQINFPSDVATDNSGNIYFSDGGNHKIRKINPEGIITTFAGTGVAGFNGDSGMATAIQLHYPNGINCDSAGNVYVADQLNNVLRKIDVLSNITTTIAGNDTPGYSGNGGIATHAKLDNPGSVTIGRFGNIYLCDIYNSVVREIKNADTSTLTSTYLNAVPNTSADLKIYPNPNSGKFTINLSSDFNEKTEFIITDIVGNKVKEITTSTNTAIDLQLDVPIGVYFLSATNSHGKWSGKIDAIKR